MRPKRGIALLGHRPLAEPNRPFATTNLEGKVGWATDLHRLRPTAECDPKHCRRLRRRVGLHQPIRCGHA
jgi:hypothetical protein